jgi:phage gp29-like protein
VAAATNPGAGAWASYFGAPLWPTCLPTADGCAHVGAAARFDLYDEMESKDGHLFSVLQTRKNGVLSSPRKIEPASVTSRDLLIARFVEKALTRIPRFGAALLNLLDAIGKGLSILEIVWEVREGQVWVRELKSRAPGRFSFAPDGTLRLSPDEFLARVDGNESRSLPDRKFLRFTFGGLYDEPYGRGLCARAYWYYWFKKNNTKFWVIYNEKFGAPTVVGKYRPGASEEERRRLFDVVESLQNDTGVTVPESITLELLEARRSGNASTYRELADWCNDEISRLVLGATLTSSEGRRSGSQALGMVHERVRGEYVEADARELEDAINSQLVRWLVDFNFGSRVEAPRWTIDTTRNDFLDSEIALDRELLNCGVPLPVAYFYEKYKRPVPAPMNTPCATTTRTCSNTISNTDSSPSTKRAPAWECLPSLGRRARQHRPFPDTPLAQPNPVKETVSREERLNESEKESEATEPESQSPSRMEKSDRSPPLFFILMSLFQKR